MHVNEFDLIVTASGVDYGGDVVNADMYACPECGAAVADRMTTHELDSNRLKHVVWHEQRAEG